MLALKSFIVEWKIKSTNNRFYMALGALFLILALVGVLLPVVPQVPFAIISAYFFSKGSARIHLWMRHNKYFGKPVREWEDFRIIRPKMKFISTLSLIVGAIIAHNKFEAPWTYVLDSIFFICAVFVLTRRSDLTPKIFK